MALPAPIQHLKTGDWLNRRRAIAYGRILLAIELLVFLFLIAGTYGWIVPLDKPLTTDFASFYAAGSLTDAGHSALAYNETAHYAAEQKATSPGIQYQFFYYPPVFMLICAVLARMPYLVAFVVFEALTLVFYLFVARKVLGEKDWGVLAPVLAFPAVFWTVGLGQNALLTAALFGAAMLLVDRRPVWSGVLFGALCYKPHLGLLIPVALAAGRRGRAFAAAAASALALCGLSVILFGWQSWQDFFTAAAASHSTYEFGRINLAGVISPFGAARLLGVAVAPAYAVQAIASLTAMALVAWVWWRDCSLEVRAATLLAATLLAVPVVLLYDLMLAALAALWLLRAARRTGFLPWEKASIVLIFIVPLLTLGLGQSWHLPVAPLAAILLLANALRRAQREAAVAPPAGAALSYRS
jgi:hypothetical protein